MHSIDYLGELHCHTISSSSPVTLLEVTSPKGKISDQLSNRLVTKIEELKSPELKAILEMLSNSCNSSVWPQMWPQAKIKLVIIPPESDSYVTQLDICRVGRVLVNCFTFSLA